MAKAVKPKFTRKQVLTKEELDTLTLILTTIDKRYYEAYGQAQVHAN
jgi:hypothetical protein